MMPFGYPQQSKVSRCSLRALAISRIIARWPPFQALRATDSLPSDVFGPVECSQGLHTVMSCACRALRSWVQPFAMLLLQ